MTTVDHNRREQERGRAAVVPTVAVRPKYKHIPRETYAPDWGTSGLYSRYFREQNEAFRQVWLREMGKKVWP